MTAIDLRLRSSLKQRNGYYIVRLSWYDAKGQRKQTNVTTGLQVVGNKYRAEAREKEIYRQYESVLLAESQEASKIFYHEWLTKWLKFQENKISPSTFYSYKIVVEKHIIPYFKDRDITLAELNCKRIESYFDYRLKSSDVSVNSLKHERCYISSSLKYAVTEGVLKYNPANGVRLPKIQKHIANTYTNEQLKTFLSAISGSELEPAILMAAWFGFRRGEVIGMRWDCIDIKNKTIAVRGTVKSQGKNGYSVYYVPSAKNNTSIRTLPMTEEQAEYFSKLKEQQKHRQAVKGYCHDFDAFICTYKDGKLISPNVLTRAVPKLTEACGLPRLKLHELRHTCLSLMIQNGISVLDAASWAGHSSPSTTQNIYAHVDARSKEKISAILAELLS